MYDLPGCLVKCGLAPKGWAEKKQPHTAPVTSGPDTVDLTNGEVTGLCADPACIDLTHDVQAQYGETLSEGMVVVYTDGAAKGNQFRSARAAGFGGFWAKEHPFNFSEALQGDVQTNNRAELMAVLRVFQLELRPLDARTDSAYVVNGILKHRHAWKSKGWQKKGRAIRNSDLWKLLDELLDARGQNSYKVTKVKGHATKADTANGTVAPADKVGNDEADALAVAGALRQFEPESLETIATVMDVQRMMVEIYVARAEAASRSRSRSSNSSSASHSDTRRDSSSSSNSAKTSSKSSSCSRSHRRRGRSAPAAAD